MNDQERLARRFEEHRTHMRAVAYRMLGSLAEADEAVQDAWLRVSGSGDEGVENLGGWLTTIVARVCLNVLRSRKLRGTNDTHVPDLVITREGDRNPEHEALLADSVGLALQVVLDTLEPAERLAFVLHDMFDLPFDDIAPLVGRTPDAARQLASRARRRIQGVVPDPEPDIARQREVVDAFFAAARAGSFDALVAVLHPDVVLRVDGGSARPSASTVVRGAEAVAGRAIRFAQPRATLKPALVNGLAGVVITLDAAPFTVMGFTVARGKVVEIHAVSDPDRLREIDLAALDD
ncbi:RNA polymerase sigma factor SigJ [soil metagenome]